MFPSIPVLGASHRPPHPCTHPTLLLLYTYCFSPLKTGSNPFNAITRYVACKHFNILHTNPFARVHIFTNLTKKQLNCSLEKASASLAAGSSGGKTLPSRPASCRPPTNPCAIIYEKVIQDLELPSMVFTSLVSRAPSVDLKTTNY